MSNINKNIIMQAGPAIANATNKAAGLPSATPEPGSFISVIQLVNGGRTIGPDSLAHLTESVRNKLLSLLVTLEPIQDFNGFDHPWPAGGGKNLFGGTLIDGYVPLDLPVGTYTVSAAMINPSRNTYFYIRRAATGTTSYEEVVKPIVLLNVFPETFTVETGYDYYAWSNASYNNVKDVQIELGSTATEWTPYENVCPISGRTGLHVYAGPTSAIGDAATYSMAWTSPAGTVYAGSADIVTGDIKAAPYYASYNGETLVGPWVSSMDVYDQEGTPTTGAQVVDLGGTMTEYHITGQDIITLVGDNYIWSDSGDVTIKE